MVDITDRAPTAPWVDLLVEKLGVPEGGDEIPMDDIANVLNTERHSRHYQTIVAAWKKRLFTVHGVVITTSSGKYVAASDDGKVLEAVRLRTRAGKAMGRAAAILNVTDSKRLTEKSRQAYDTMKANMTRTQELLIAKLLN